MFHINFLLNGYFLMTRAGFPMTTLFRLGHLMPPAPATTHHLVSLPGSCTDTPPAQKIVSLNSNREPHTPDQNCVIWDPWARVKK